MGVAPSAKNLALEPDHLLLHPTRHQVTSFQLLRSTWSVPDRVDKSSLHLSQYRAERNQRQRGQR